MWKRSTYSFTHPEAKGPKLIKAFSEKAAWNKMRKWVISMINGGWAFFYDSAKVDAVMAKVTIEKL